METPFDRRTAALDTCKKLVERVERLACEELTFEQRLDLGAMLEVAAERVGGDAAVPKEVRREQYRAVCRGALDYVIDKMWDVVMEGDLPEEMLDLMAEDIERRRLLAKAGVR